MIEEITVKCDLILFYSSKDVLVNINSSIIFFSIHLNHRIQNILPMKLDLNYELV
jgi:hypothetical protein